MSELLHPSAALLSKLASIAVHADELLSSDAHDVDRAALLSSLDDAEVSDWIAGMTSIAMAPLKRMPR